MTPEPAESTEIPSGAKRAAADRHAVTERQLELAQERFRLAFEHAAIGMTISSPEGRFVRVNHVFCEMLGYSSAELRRMQFVDVIHPDDRPAYHDRVRRMLAGEAEHTHGEKRYVRKDGTTLWTEISAALIRDPDGRPEHLITQVHDITDRRRALEELERSNAELTQFASTAAHDLTEPLRIVEGYLQLLSRRYRGALDARADEFIDHTLDAVERMRNLIEALLNYARTGTSEAMRKPVDSHALAADALRALDATVQERGATIQLRDLPEVQADPALLRQVFQNLLGNSLRFADVRAPLVWVTARTVDDGWEFSVADNGPGIPPQERERVFEMLRRGSTSADAPARGAGIGLAICKRAVESHGGRIWIEEGPRGGADVRFTIPEQAP